MRQVYSREARPRIRKSAQMSGFFRSCVSMLALLSHPSRSPEILTTHSLPRPKLYAHDAQDGPRYKSDGIFVTPISTFPPHSS
ncbi:hypothetical protein VTH06DRAFT_3952 [Thermothelomyces fergusii]